MIYRRLPNTDRARITAIEHLIEKIDQGDCYEILTDYQISELKTIGSDFISLVNQRENFKNQRKELNATKAQIYRNLKLNISHFFQVLNFAIVREEIEKSARSLFGLKPNDGAVPLLISEKSILEWSHQVIKGESKRTADGDLQISHPNQLTIETLIENEQELQKELKSLVSSESSIREAIITKRTAVDSCIKKAWDDIEFFFKNEPSDLKRAKNKSFGVIYFKNTIN